jgi:glycosyltransferase involved in cell wall biosynthesis
MTDSKSKALGKRHIVFVINSVAFFVSHRLLIAQAALERGWDVSLVAGERGSLAMEASAESILYKSSISLIRVPIKTAGLNPFYELIGLFFLLKAILKLKPDIIHTASPKGNIYGSLVARIAGVKHIMVSITGMGYLFTGEARGTKKLLKTVYLYLMRLGLAHPSKIVTVENKDDYAEMIAHGFAKKDQLLLIAGSGVDLDAYSIMPSCSDGNVVLLPARLLADKGVREFVDAARILRAQGCTWRFVLVGAADYGNPSAITRQEIEAWVSDGDVEWWGYFNDMPSAYHQAAIVCLPSYREGMPKSLLEAAATGKAIVTTDVTGCREAIIPGVTGDLVTVRNAHELASCLQSLIDDPQRRKAYGIAGRAFVESGFSVQSVIEMTLNGYDMLLES